MISKMNYLLLSTMMIAAIDSTFGRCCHCPCWKEEKNINDQNNENNIGNLINNENLGNEKENINDQNTWNNGKKNKKKKKKGKNTNGDGIKNKNEKKESDKNVEKILLQNDFPHADNKIVGDNQKIEGIFKNAVEILKQNNAHSCKDCKNEHKRTRIVFYTFNKHRTAKKKYKDFFIYICSSRKCEVHHKCKEAPSVLLACGHVACNKCCSRLEFCKQCKGYYCKRSNGCNNHTLCNNCKSTYICNNKDSGGSGKCPSCANSK